MSFAPVADDELAPFRICFVCTGNICRSPMAEVVLRDIVARAGYDRLVQVSSAGTGEWHVGEPADARTITALACRGYDASRHRARQFEVEWFDLLDLIVVLDRTQERILGTWAPTERDRSKVQRLLSFDPEQSGLEDIADPYYSDAAMFENVLNMIEKSCRGLFRQLQPGIQRAAELAGRKKGDTR